MELAVVALNSQPALTITIQPKEAGRLRLSEFLSLTRELVDAVRELELSGFEESQRPSDWFVVDCGPRADGAFSLKVQPETASAAAAANQLRVGLRFLERRASQPPYFTSAVMRHADKALRFLGDSVESFAISTVKGTPAAATPRMAERVRTLLNAGYNELTSLDGQLRRIEWDEESPRFYVIDSLTGARVRCNFNKDHLEQAKLAFPHRVEVSGLLTYSASGVPQTIDVSHFDRIPDEADLPTLEDFRGMNFTNGMDPAELVWRHRHGE